MAEKTAIAQPYYTSDNPEQDWERFQDAMRHTLKMPKEKIENLRLGKQHEDAERQEEHVVTSVSAERETL